MTLSPCTDSAQECECYLDYLTHHQPKHHGPKLTHEDYHLAEEAFLQAGRNLTEWILGHLWQDPQSDVVGKAYWDEVTRWERIAAM